MDEKNSNVDDENPQILDAEARDPSGQDEESSPQWLAIMKYNEKMFPVHKSSILLGWVVHSVQVFIQFSKCENQCVCFFFNFVMLLK